MGCGASVANDVASVASASDHNVSSARVSQWLQDQPQGNSWEAIVEVAARADSDADIDVMIAELEQMKRDNAERRSKISRGEHVRLTAELLSSAIAKEAPP